MHNLTIIWIQFEGGESKTVKPAKLYENNCKLSVKA